MDLAVLFSTFGVIFVAELGDKTQLTAMALASRYPWKKTFAGIAAAFVLLNLLAVVVGKVLFLFVPLFWIQLASGVLFLGFGIATLTAANDEGDEKIEQKAGRPFITSFTMILLAELGDKTQLMTASLAARHASQTAVFVGSTLALWVVSLLGIFLGKRLTALLPMSMVHKVAGVVFLLFAVVILARLLPFWGS